MVKIIITVLIMISLLFTFGCAKSTNPQLEEKETAKITDTESKTTYTYCTIYVSDYLSNADPKLAAFFNRQLRVEPQTVERESDISPEFFQINNTIMVGEYLETRTQINIRQTPFRFYKTEHGRVGTDQATGELVYINFNTSTSLDAQKDTVLNRDQCESIVLDFLNTMISNDKLSEYTVQKSDLQIEWENTPYEKHYYNFSYRKIIDGKMTSDSYRVSITERGSIFSFRRGDEIDSQKVEALQINYEEVENIVKDFAEESCNILQAKSTEYSFSEPALFLLKKDVYALDYSITITYVTDDGEIETNVVVAIPLENG